MFKTDEEFSLDQDLICLLHELAEREDDEGYLSVLIDALAKVTTVDNGEPLVPLTADLVGQRIFFNLVSLGIPTSDQDRLQLRQGVISRLRAASETLPTGFSLIVRDAFRTRQMVLDLYALYLKRVQEENPSFTHKECDLNVRMRLAMPDDPVLPGHMTGGAVDVVLGDDRGNRVFLEVNGDLIPRKKQAFTDCPGLPPDLQLKRRILLDSLTTQGFHNFFQEYWHFSYGDAYWAVRRKCKQAIYGVPSRSHPKNSSHPS